MASSVMLRLSGKFISLTSNIHHQPTFLYALTGLGKSKYYAFSAGFF